MEYVLSKSDVGLLIILDVSANIEVIAEKSAFNVGVITIRLSEILTLCTEAPLLESYIIPLSIDLDVEDEDSNSAELFSVSRIILLRACQSLEDSGGKTQSMDQAEAR